MVCVLSGAGGIGGEVRARRTKRDETRKGVALAGVDVKGEYEERGEREGWGYYRVSPFLSLLRCAAVALQCQFNQVTDQPVAGVRRAVRVTPHFRASQGPSSPSPVPEG